MDIENHEIIFKKLNNDCRNNTVSKAVGISELELALGYKGAITATLGYWNGSNIQVMEFPEKTKPETKWENKNRIH